MADLPIGSIVMFDGVTPPVGWYDCDGSTHSGITTPNLVGRFVKGVPVAGTLGTTGGSTTHIHTNLDTGYQTHGHAATSGNSGMDSGTSVYDIWQGSTYSGVETHQHLVSASAVSNQFSHTHTVPNTSTGSSMPYHIRLRFIMRCE